MLNASTPRQAWTAALILGFAIGFLLSWVLGNYWLGGIAGFAVAVAVGWILTRHFHQTDGGDD